MCAGAVWPHSQGMGCKASPQLSGEHRGRHHMQSVGPPGTVCGDRRGTQRKEHMEPCCGCGEQPSGALETMELNLTGNNIDLQKDIGYSSMYYTTYVAYCSIIMYKHFLSSRIP